jgi:hypothetical protein
MKRFQAFLVLLLVIVPVALLTAAPDTGEPCATALEGWGKLADTSVAVPRFMIQGHLDIDRLLVCDSGTYFFFRTRERGRFIRVCLAYPKPSQQEMAKYHGRGETNVQERVTEVLTATARAEQSYAEFEAQLQEALGTKYAEGRLMSFENDRWKPRLEVELGQPFEFTWRHRSVSFFALPDIYFAPGSKVSPWLLVLLLYPGPVDR